MMMVFSDIVYGCLDIETYVQMLKDTDEWTDWCHPYLTLSYLLVYSSDADF